MYKKSNYNIFVPYKENKTIIYNGLSGAVGIFDDKTLNNYNNDTLSIDEQNILLKKGILIDENFDEKQKMFKDRNAGVMQKNDKHFRIWPTSACNAQCYYCFEKGISCNTMTMETAKDVVKFIDSMLEENDHLEFEWFGGEPLLNIKVIDYIVEQIRVKCKQKNCNFNGTMITNGSLITPEIAKKIKNDWNIYSIQITLDGFGDFYNEVKNYKNSKLFNFDRVIESIKYLSKEGVHVAVRMNYDRKNYSSLVELINFLHEEMKDYKNISYYVYPVWSSTDENAVDQFCSETEADLDLLKLMDLLVKYNMNTARKIARLNYKVRQCQTWNINSFAILPNGDITKCCEVYHQVIGNIWDGITDKKTYNYWASPDIDEKCETCKYLPICQGGCKASHFGRMPQCFAFKPIFDEVLKWYVEQLEKGSK